MRHAEAEDSFFEINDFQRRLTDKGVLAACKVAYQFRLHFIPDCILTSNAHRTLETTELILKEFTGCSIHVVSDSSLYLAPSMLLHQKVMSLEEHINKVILVGHNPGVSDWVFTLTGEHVSLSPAMAVMVRLPISSWKLLTSQIGTIEKIISP